MKNTVLKPIFNKGVTNPSLSCIEDGNSPASNVAGFNWRSLDFPYMHTHNHWEILLVLNGKVEHIINNVVHRATKGYACIVRPDDIHCYRFLDKKKSETLTFVFSKEVAEKLFCLYPKLLNLNASTQPLTFALNEETLNAVLSKTLTAQLQPKPIYEQYCILIVNRVLSAYVEKKLNTVEAYPDWLNSFLSFLKNPEHLRMPIPELATHAPYSYSHLSSLFKEYTGKTIINYIKELKLIRAKELLRNTDKSVIEIADELNYESVSSLNHNFKQFTGLTPTQFRKSKSDY